MPCAHPVQAAIHANVALLEQGLRLLASLDHETYRQRMTVCFDASIGGHLRHILDHYLAFFSILDDAELNYERRARSPAVENELGHATRLLHSTARQLLEIAPTLDNRPLRYRTETAEGNSSPTSVLRELEFLLSHTLHHYALIAVMARLQGLEPPPELGLAPATLKFQQAQAACAR